MKIITGYIQKTGGDAFVGGINVSDDPLSVKKKIGYLPELNALYYEMYVREYLGFVASIHKVVAKKQRMEEVISLTGLTFESKKKIGQLSKGYKQRVGLAAALIHDPEVLVLDEPTSGLDPNQIVEIREVIRKQGEKKTVLFSSHILQEVEAICDRVIIIHRGQLVADDKLANLRRGASGQTTVLVSFAESIEEERLRIQGVNRLEKISSNSFRLYSDDTEALRRKILQFALDNHLNIVSLQAETQSLENIFKELTGN
jgi:ABC-2 type transport system ATP-binding protein